MNKYIIGKNIDGVQNLDIEDAQTNDITHSIVVVILDSESNNKLYSYYSAIKSLIIKGNKVILVMVRENSKIRQPLCMLMTAYQRYDIYTTDDEDIIDYDYVQALEERTPSEEEAYQYIDRPTITDNEISELLLDLNEAVDKSDMDRLVDIITQKRFILEDSVRAIDNMRHAMANISSGDSDKKLQGLKLEKAELEKKLQATNDQLHTIRNTSNSLIEDNALLKKESFISKNRVKELEEQINSIGPVIKTYTTILTSTIKCKAKSIIYFKEISYVRYANTFILKLAENIDKVHKLRVKLLIYDNKNSFNAVYKPINVIGSAEYISNTNTFVNSMDKLVIVECNQAIMDDMLKADYDVVIIYDRLKQSNDLVAGNNVYKYWVLNSSTDYDVLQPIFKLEKQHIITRPGLFQESIALMDIDGYKSMTNSGRTAAYMRMLLDNKKKVLDAICERTNIVSIQPRG